MQLFFYCSQISLQDKPWSVLRTQLGLDVTNEAPRLMHVLLVQTTLLSEDGRCVLHGEIRSSLGAEDTQGLAVAWSME